MILAKHPPVQLPAAAPSSDGEGEGTVLGREALTPDPAAPPSSFFAGGFGVGFAEAVGAASPSGGLTPGEGCGVASPEGFSVPSGGSLPATGGFTLPVPFLGGGLPVPAGVSFPPGAVPAPSAGACDGNGDGVAGASPSVESSVRVRLPLLRSLESTAA